MKAERGRRVVGFDFDTLTVSRGFEAPLDTLGQKSTLFERRGMSERATERKRQRVCLAAVAPGIAGRQSPIDGSGFLPREGSPAGQRADRLAAGVVDRRRARTVGRTLSTGVTIDGAMLMEVYEKATKNTGPDYSRYA